jgi:hypothetical protein
MAKKGFHKPLDDSHQPFKRLRKIGSGPRGREPIYEKKDYECFKIKGEKYRQLCIFVGKPGKGHKAGSKKLVITKKAWKKGYNKEYSRWRLARPVKPRVNAAQPAYKYRAPRQVIAMYYTRANDKNRRKANRRRRGGSRRSRRAA